MKFFGVIGYNKGTEEVRPGVWENVVEERPAYGDVLRNSRTLVEGDKVNNDITVTNSISIVADAYANEHFFEIVYIQWQGKLWNVENVSVEPPRLVFRLGGLYNGPTAPVEQT